ncbi:MAG: hypothetical protein EXR33_04885 [Betaproteobacteria bacterium]|nr:hypothetical protein [Betaproteobacteria bacterium]
MPVEESPNTNMSIGTHHWPAQERVTYGRPAVEALAEEVARAEARQADVSAAFGGRNGPAGVCLKNFVAGLGLPVQLRDVGVAKDELPAIAASWDGSGPITTNPRKIRGKEDLLEILELAW